ncbi:hypothetical protein [Streptomyces sp. NPDC052496]|uniref:hypothetical protein n=1 Tax=Streptomyces sp. NPDC052496 TaxID=3154951 RepID=UPI0034389B33
MEDNLSVHSCTATRCSSLTGNALCVARGQAFVDQALKTKRELGITGKHSSRIIGTAHGKCGRKLDW